MGNYVALSELKSALSITGSTEDTFLNLAIDSAETNIDTSCGRVFTLASAATARVYRSSSNYLTVSDDIGSLTGLVIKTDTAADGTFDTTWAASDYQLEPLNGLAMGDPVRTVRAVGDYTFPVYRDGLAPIQITAKWGFPTVPESIKQAALMLSSRLYNRKASALGVISVGDFGAVRISRSDPDIAAMLLPYRLPPVA